MRDVIALREQISLPTYGVGTPEKNPAFYEKRVYQGSCGKVYPVPFIDKVHDDPFEQTYDSARLENDYVRLVMLPEIGGRIFLGQDKINNDYDFFYRQNVIKPALVGLAGPWISGGVEFNWSQHHRPGTFMPADVHIEDHPDGARTVWLSEHDPINRMKGMHGVCLQPDSALVELKVRLFNRTPMTQTFLWWANAAARVHDNYQSFFPPDVHYVADHAVRAMSSFPIARNDYYGVDYAARTGANDLTWYKNIPVPTSYMICDTQFDFLGGYDYDAQGGFIHVANKHIAPGKKQWTWGNHDFGWAWDRELTDTNGPYIELMAGVYTDNQPDFAYLAPYETKTFSQYWWPYQRIGPVQNATKDAAVRLVVNDDRSLDLGAAVSRKMEGARIVLRAGEQNLLDQRVDLSPEEPWRNQQLKFDGDALESLELSIEGMVAYRPIDTQTLERKRGVAKEPSMPAETATVDELFLTAEHLEQYRHPTRYPESYWKEALRRDPLDSRTHIAFGRHLLAEGCFDDAAQHLKKAIARLTDRHPNPYTGEAHYYLGLTCRLQGELTDAYAAFYKSTWNYAWRAAAYYELAALDCRNGDFDRALEHIEAALDTNRQNNKAHVLKAIILRKRGERSSEVLSDLLAIDPLDHWARYESGDVDGFQKKSRNDAQTVLDIAYDYADAGFIDDAIRLLELHHANEVAEVAVPNPLSKSQLTHYALAWLTRDADCLSSARSLSPDYCFPSRLHDEIVLRWALDQAGDDRNAAFGLGNYLFDRKRHEEAIAAWETARAADPTFATVCRNLGIAYWNIRRNGEAARRVYLQALENDPADARIFSEYDQLRKKIGDPAQDRLQTLLSRPELVEARDDCSVELASLYNETDRPDKALKLLMNRRFHPWEGGEGKVLKQYTTARLLLGETAMNAGDPATALEHFSLALNAPRNLGEAYHLLQGKADVNYWKGRALRALGREAEAVKCFEAAESEAGDFQSMAVTEHSELSYFRGLSMIELGQTADAKALFDDFRRFAEVMFETESKIDYFATSLPQLLVFEDDLNETNRIEAKRLLALAEKGLRQMADRA